MSAVLVAIILIFLLLAAGLAIYLVRRPGEAPPPEELTNAVAEEDAAERQATLEQRGSELLERRVELDARRGTLGGQQEVFEAFERLEDRLRGGEISEEEFEQEKIRLLGG